MNSAPDAEANLAPPHAALQHGNAAQHSPRPLPLFLELVRQEAGRDPALARKALRGLDCYADAPRIPRSPEPPAIASVNGASLRDHGGSGPPLILVPSLINPPHILDLDPDTSLAAALTAKRRVLLLDWGKASERGGLSISDHVEDIVIPLIAQLGEPPTLLGYCLGGTMALAAAGMTRVERLATLAAPWHFDRYPSDARGALAKIWSSAQAPSAGLGALPMEVLQAAFWALDPARTVAKFARFAELDPTGDAARRFVMLEDWANEGEPLPLPAARELFEDLFGADVPGRGAWMVGGKAAPETSDVPTLHLVAAHDHIVPAGTAPAGRAETIESGHVGMIVGRARHTLHQKLSTFLAN